MVPDEETTQSCVGETCPFMTSITPSSYRETDVFVDEDFVQC